MGNLRYKNLVDKKVYLSPEFEMIEIKLTDDILSASGEGPLEPSVVPTAPDPTSYSELPDGPLDD